MTGPLLDLEKPKPLRKSSDWPRRAWGSAVFAGIWVACPALTGNRTVCIRSDAAVDSDFVHDMMARPDPLPYRTATSAFDTAADRLRASAKARAQPATSGQALRRIMRQIPGDATDRVGRRRAVTLRPHSAFTKLRPSHRTD